MEWQQLLGFQQVARLGSFTQAARVTFRTQPALSQQIKALEEELGCRLFERIGKRKLQLTAAGEQLRQFAETLLGEYEHLKERLNELNGIPKGRLRLAAPFTTLYHLFPEALQTYIKQFPRVELTILDRPQHQVLALVKSGEIDFGLTLASLVPKELVALPWQEVGTFLMTPPDHPLTRRPRPTWRQIARYPLILPPRSPEYAGRLRLEERFQKLGLDYHIILESANVELSALFVERGLGLAFATLVKNRPHLHGRNLSFIPLEGYFKPDYLAVVRRRNQPDTAFKEAWLRILLGGAVSG